MILARKVKLKPNIKQQNKLFQNAGVSRWAYNWALDKQQKNYKNGGKFIKDSELRKELTQLKKQEEYKWLNNYSNNITKQSIKDACNAYKRFFKGESKFPKFKSRKKSKPSFYVDTEKIKFGNGKVKLEKLTTSRKKAKFNWIRLAEKQRIPYGEDVKYSNPRVSFDDVNWYISVGVEVHKKDVELTTESIGIDVGIKDLAICSDGKVYKNINKTQKVKKLEKRLRRLQLKVSNKYQKNKKGESYCKTSNIIKLENNIKKLHKRLDNIRTDYRHKVTTEIVKTKPSRIVMESLNVSGMLKNKYLSKSVAQQGFYEIKRMMEYKCELYNIEFIETDKWYPSSKTCSKCGYIKPKLSLSERTFICEECGNVIDRDLNASINLSRYKIS